MKIAVVGIGYVGLSAACLLAQHSLVTAVDLLPEKVRLINSKKSPFSDSEIEECLQSKSLRLIATTDGDSAYCGADLVIIATPTNYDESKNFFDTSSVEAVIEQVIKVNSNATIVIKSTVPVGFTEEMLKKHPGIRLLFSPEFLREGRTLYDNLYPSRIIIGVPEGNETLQQSAEVFAGLLADGAVKDPIEIRYMKPAEAEAVKLFSNTYLALRISFFNELDTYAMMHGLDTKAIIEGVGLDPRIGLHYNNPSFGYGGYCLPKDTKQLLASYDDIPQSLISAIVAANATRKAFIAGQIIKGSPRIVGIYRLTAKEGTDNFRQSAIIDIIERIRASDIETVIYEPTAKENLLYGSKVIYDIEQFKKISDIILANRYHSELQDVRDKVFTRDLFSRD